MKTFKTIVLLCLLAGFTVNAAHAQATVQKTVNSEGYDIPCGAGEHASGDLIFSTLINKNIFRFSAHGKLIGDVTGTVYLIDDGGGNDFHLTGGDGLVWDFTWKVIIHANGKPLFKAKWLAHVTVNANGEVTSVFFDKGGEECLN